MNKMFPYSRQKIDSQDIKSVAKVMRSDYLTQGPIVNKLEKKIAKFSSAKYSVCVNSVTDSIKISLKALNIGQGDEVITAANTFVATVGAIN